MFTKLFGLVLSTVLVGALPSQATPLALVDQVFTTYDPNTGLQWADVNFTLNISHDTVVADYLGVGDPFEGYRYATGAEVSTLFSNAGIANPYAGPLNATESALYSQLISLLGPTFNQAGVAYVLGLTADPNPLAPTSYVRARLQLSHDGIGIALAQYDALFGSQQTVDGGSFLVRDLSAVPLPATFPFFAAGLGALVLLGRARKRKTSAAGAAV